MLSVYTCISMSVCIVYAELLCGMLGENNMSLLERVGEGKPAKDWDRVAAKARSVSPI